MNCPECGSSRTHYEKRRVPRLKGGYTQSGWHVCLDCWFKWGATNKADGVLPAGVKRREKRSWYKEANGG